MSHLRTGALLLVLAPLAAQDPRLVVDLNPGGSSAGAFPILGRGPRPGELLVALDDGVRGQELWRTDGTAAGTQLVTELVPGPAGANIVFGSGGALGCWFVADRGLGQELWRTDGTAAGTSLQFSAAAIGASAFGSLEAQARIGNHWLFLADNQLRLTDGTAAGTQALGIGYAVGATAAGGEFWVVEPGALRVHAITPTSPATIVSFADAYVTSLRGEPILEQFTIQRFGQRTFTTLTAIRRPGQPSVANIPGQVFPIPLGDGLIYVDDQGQMWRWDVASPPVPLTRLGASVVPGPMLFLRDRLLFTGQDGVTGIEPWVTDGTQAGTQPVDLTPGIGSSVFAFAGQVATGARALLWLDTPQFGSEPWSTDGTVAGTQLLADLEPGPGNSLLAGLVGYGTPAGQRRQVLPVITSARGSELWLTDGTVAGSRWLNEFVPGPGDGVDLSTWYPDVAGHRVVVGVDDGVHGRELWAMDFEGSSTPLLSQGSRAFDVIGDAAFGGAIEFASRGLQARDFGAAMVGLPAVAAPLGLGGTLLLVDLGTALPLLPIVPGPGGGWSQQLAVPNLPALAGLELVAQGAFAGSSIGAGVELGAAWWLCLGN